jgi:hypothetical protein
MGLLFSIPLWVLIGCQCYSTAPTGTEHLKQRQKALTQLEKGVPMSEQEPLIEKFNYHQRRLVELGIFDHVYVEIPIDSVPENIDLGAYLLQHFHDAENADISRAWFEVDQSSPASIAVELWGTPDQVSLMKKIVAKQVDENEITWEKLNAEEKIRKTITSAD